MTRRLTALVLTAMLLVAGIAGIAAAATFHDQTHSVNSSTDSVYVDVEDTNGTNVTATFYGVDSNGNETQEKQVTLNAGANETDSATLTDVDAANYTQYRVVVEGTGDAPASVSSGITESSGGGGFALDDEWFGVPAWIVILLGISAAGVLKGNSGNGGRKR